jgi:hypothetical protein
MNQPPLDRIHLLSARFHELHGLRVALTGACIALVVGSYLAFSPTPTNNGALVALVVSFVPVIPGVFLLNRYYATTFGRQVGTPPEHLRYLPLFWFLYFGLSVILNAAIPSIPAGAPTAVTAALLSVWVAIRDWPHRAHYLVVTVAVAIGFTVSASGAGLLPANLTLGTIFVLLGVSFVPVGVLDHLLLVRLIKEARQAQTSSPTA